MKIPDPKEVDSNLEDIHDALSNYEDAVDLVYNARSDAEKDHAASQLSQALSDLHQAVFKAGSAFGVKQLVATPLTTP